MSKNISDITSEQKKKTPLTPASKKSEAINSKE